MNRLRFTLALFVTLLFLSGCNFDEPLSVRIAHINDTHSHFDEQLMPVGLPDANGNPALTYTYVGGYPRLKTKIDQLRDQAELDDQNFLLLHGGDAFAGTLFFSLFQGDLNAEFMNLFGFDAMVLGNHEFDLGNEKLAEFADKVNFPLLSANTKTTFNDPLFGKYAPYTIKMMGKGKDKQPVAIVGLTTEFTALISSPSDQTTFKDIVEVSQTIVDHIQATGLNKIIFVTHLGLDEDRMLAQLVAGIDVIIGGHSPTLLGDHRNIGLGNDFPSPVMETAADGSPVCIMHAIEESLGLGVTDVEFSGMGEVTSCSGQNTFLVGNIFAQGTPPTPVSPEAYQVISSYIASIPNVEIVEKDVETQSILDAAKLEVEAFASTVVGVTSDPLLHVRLPGDTHPSGPVLGNGSLVAPHVAASMAFKAEQTSGERYVAVMNAGGVRADMTGEISVGTAYSVLPFNSTLVTMSISGSVLEQVISSAVSNAYLISSVTFPYVANIKYDINLSDPAAPVVTNIMVLDGNGVYQPIDSAETYNLATTSYLAGGGDGYQFPGATNQIDTGHVDADILVQYVESQPGGVLNIIESGINVSHP